jgi:hypothetical protein
LHLSKEILPKKKMKELIYEIKLEANQLSQKSDEEFALKIDEIKKRARK